MLLLGFLLLLFSPVLADTTSNKPYQIRSKSGTSLDQFWSWIQQLDEGAGYLIPGDNEDHQTYLTDLTASQVDEIQKKDFILSVSAQGSAQTDTTFNQPVPLVSNDLRRGKRKDDGRPIPNQLKGYPPIQWSFLNYKGKGMPPYGPEWRTDSGGQGVNLFVLDSGFNLNLGEIRPADTYTPPNSLFDTVLPGTDAHIMPASLTDRLKHGTSMASVAAGQTLGIAPSCNLYLGKFNADYRSPNGQVLSGSTWASWNHIFNWVINMMHLNWERGLRKNVVLMSMVTPRSDYTEENDVKRLFQSFIDRLDGYEALLVNSAGNKGLEGRSLGDGYPTSLAKPTNNVAVIGGCNLDGSLWTSTTPPKGSGIEIDLWALATGIDVMLADGTVVKNAGCSGTCLSGGTSTAAAMAAGTATWFLGLNKCEAYGLGIDLKDLYYPDPNGHSLWPEDPFTTPKVMGLKRLLKKSTYPRSSQILAPGHSPPPYDLPHQLNTIYNLDKGPPP